MRSHDLHERITSEPGGSGLALTARMARSRLMLGELFEAVPHFLNGGHRAVDFEGILKRLVSPDSSHLVHHTCGCRL